MGSVVRRVVAGAAAATVAAGLTGGAGGATAAEIPAVLPDLQATGLLDAAAVALPPEGVTLQLHADFPAEAPLESGGLAFTSVTADVSPAGELTMLSATPATPAETSTPRLDECTDPTFEPTGPRWYEGDLPVEWRFRRGSVPEGVGRFRSQYSLQAAHQVWSRARTVCKAKDDVSMQFSFAGPTARRVGYDGVNVADFGPLGAGALAMSYTWYQGGHILEVDLRLNRHDYRWTNRPGGKNRYQVANVAAHEIGHQLGLDDLADPHGALTMFGRISRGETSKTTLGRGDLRGASALSP
ncbi:MAG TPA: matrixin family metalloprotease [Actinomycetota bacterium]|nr:matrixin family metalloprotease [Actinomycetota bacterium]